MNASASTPIYSITPFTLLDYPHQSACILWFAGCNMRCLYCYNPEIVLGKGKLSFQHALDFLQTRKNLLDAVVFSGGECLLHKKSIEFIATVKKMGFLVKIDTNGSQPKVLQTLIDQQTIDYVALDFKAMPYTFEKITQSDLFAPFEQSLDLLLHHSVPFEVRTTIHSELISKENLRDMVNFLEQKGYQGNYYLQYFVNDAPTIEKMGYSQREINVEELSTVTIQLVIRN
ncbi:anaerobic ribonucleoside-triphosphate reductase activating protein [Flavobacterium sp. RSSA_27]|uniref:anaerobic ribonucleoside-triphosphate reductase activating protein n=1 Tax=Flavobacterium sp. RSSA_27 TaxID=3447667 RepID=UPI003F338724